MNALAEALQTIKTTAPLYFKDATDHTIRGRLILKILKERGNVIMNMKAPQMLWDIEVREPKVRALGGGDRHTFNETDAFEQLVIDHAELESTDIMKRRFQMINSNSPNAIVDEVGKKMDRIVKALTRKLNAQFYVDNTTGQNTNMLTGLGSFVKPATITSGDLVAIPASGATYGGKSIELGSLGGQWSATLGTSPNTAAATDWPFGSGSSEYDYNTPKLFNTSATVGGDAGWANNCLKLMRRMTNVLESTGGQGAAPVVHLMGSDKYSEFQDKLEEKERTYISDYAKSLGFPSILQYQEAVVVKEYDCPADRAFAVNPEHMALYSVHDELFFTDSDWSTESQLSAFLGGFLGNFCWTPKYVGAYLDL